MVRLKGDSDVLALSWSNAAPYWHHTEHTQPTVVLGSCTGYKGHTVTPATSAVVKSNKNKPHLYFTELILNVDIVLTL